MEENKVKTRQEPLVLVDTADLPNEEWLAWRRRSIGGSDVAAILGVSPFRTARDLYFDKLNIVLVQESESNWVALEMSSKSVLVPLVSLMRLRLMRICWPIFWIMRSLGCRTAKKSTSIPSPAFTGRLIQPAVTWVR